MKPRSLAREAGVVKARVGERAGEVERLAADAGEGDRRAAVQAVGNGGRVHRYRRWVTGTRARSGRLVTDRARTATLLGEDLDVASGRGVAEKGLLTTFLIHDVSFRLPSTPFGDGPAGRSSRLLTAARSAPCGGAPAVSAVC